MVQDKTQQPLLIIRSVDKPDEVDQTKIMIGGYFSHFEVWDEGNSSAAQVTVALMKVNRKDWLEYKQVDVLRIGESIRFQPVLCGRDEGDYFILCWYRNISHEETEENRNQTWLPFNLSKASKEGVVYVKAGELESKFNVLIDDKIHKFLNKLQ